MAKAQVEEVVVEEVEVIAEEVVEELLDPTPKKATKKKATKKASVKKQPKKVEEEILEEELLEEIIDEGGAAMPTNAVAVKEASTPVDFTQCVTVQQQLDLAQVAIDSGLTAFKRPAQVVTAMTMATTLDLKPMVALSHIHVIEGKPTFSWMLVGGLLKQRGIEFDWVEDMKKVNIAPKDAKPVIVNRTTIEFIYFCPVRKEVVKKRHSFTLQQAQLQGLTNKDNWKRMPKQMLRARCITDGARANFPDIFLGIPYTTEEMVDASGKDASYNSEGQIIEVHDAEVLD